MEKETALVVSYASDLGIWGARGGRMCEVGISQQQMSAHSSCLFGNAMATETDDEEREKKQKKTQGSYPQEFI